MASSSSAITMLLLVTTVVIALTVDCSSAADEVPIQCGTAAPVDWGDCKGHYSQCVTNLLTALRNVTPAKNNRLYSRSYPRDGGRGGVTGTAACVYSYSIQECQVCLGNAQEWLDSNCASFDSGHYVTSVCTMYYTQIPY